MARFYLRLHMLPALELTADPTHRFFTVVTRISRTQLFTGRLNKEFLDRATYFYSLEKSFTDLTITIMKRNPRCVNNLGDVDKYRYSVALVELGFGTDATHPTYWYKYPVVT